MRNVSGMAIQRAAASAARTARVVQHASRLQRYVSIDHARFLSVASGWSNSHSGSYNGAARSSSAASTTPGLFQLPDLFHPRDFKRLAEEAKTKCIQLKHEITTATPGLRTIQSVLFAAHLDEISNTICSVIDAAELCRNVHPDEAYRNAASDCFTELSDFIQNLNADVELYNALHAVAIDAGLMATFTEEQRRMAVLLRKEFERDGIHLPHSSRRHVIKLQNEITQLSMDFQRTMFTARDFVEVPEKLIRPLPHGILASCERKLLNRSVVRVPTDLHVMNTVLKWVGDPAVRKEMYIKGNTCAKENLVILDELRKKRHALAEILGFESFARLAMSDRMMTSPEEIEGFVSSLAKNLMPKARQELQLISSAKQSHERRHGSGSSGEVAMWDLPYYMGMLKAQRYRIDSRVLAGYFPLERCLDGLGLICRELFGLELSSLPMDKHEAWHPDVQKLGLKTSTGDIVGYIYFDLYPRQFKYNHAAHFTVRCGKRLSESEYQKPLVALVCNFNKPEPAAPSLLNHSEVETLFHEFGHAMHSLLSRTEFQHLSGTRASLDFVETPSHLFEYFAWDYRVVHEFARHYQTNEPIPRDMMHNLKQSKHMFAAMDAQTQCMYSLLDLQLFGDKQPPHSTRTTTQTLQRLQDQHTVVSHVDGTYWHTRFGHLIGYGAGYYSYLYARVFASAIWGARFQADPFDAQAGRSLHEELMSQGGARDANEILKSLLGGQAPSPGSYLEELGIGEATL